jgi:hypothetical protein
MYFWFILDNVDFQFNELKIYNWQKYYIYK